jgi:hypothetical protein
VDWPHGTNPSDRQHGSQAGTSSLLDCAEEIPCKSHIPTLRPHGGNPIPYNTPDLQSRICPENIAHYTTLHHAILRYTNLASSCRPLGRQWWGPDPGEGAARILTRTGGLAGCSGDGLGFHRSSATCPEEVTILEMRPFSKITDACCPNSRGTVRTCCILPHGRGESERAHHAWHYRLHEEAFQLHISVRVEAKGA